MPESQPAGPGGAPSPPPVAAEPSAAPEPVPAAEPHSPAPPPSADQSGQVPWPASSVGFPDLVDLLATQAYAHLTGQGAARSRDLQSARVFIDFLGVLHDKTKGRLTAQEERLLDDVLYQLRTLCISPPR